MINWGSFRGRRDEGGRYHIGVELWTMISGLGIISGAVVTLRKFYMHMLAYTCHKPGCDSKRCHQGVPNTFHEPIRIVSGDDKEYER